MSTLKIIISGGGTGGHIFPAIAIADTLKKLHPQAEILFVGAEGRMEMEKVPKAGYKIIGLPIAGFQRKALFKNFKLPFKLIKCLKLAKQTIKDFQPDVVVGVGGYASLPTLMKANSLKIPTVIQEQNSFPGISNKLLANKVKKICVAYKETEKYFPKEKIILTGNPVRAIISNIPEKRDNALVHFGLDKAKKTILVIGGSLGARTINQSIEKALPMFAKEGVQLIWQTGKFYDKAAQQAIEKLNNKGIQSFAFLNEMDLAYAASDLVISRSGAISVSELCIAAKPVIFVPSPNVAEDHQTKNAMALVNQNAAILIKDSEAVEKLGETAIELIKDETKCHNLSSKIALLAKPNAADIIAKEILKLIEPE